MTEHEDREVLAYGAWGRVIAVRSADGSLPARDWLVGLNDAEQAAMKARLDRLAETGTQKTPENFRRVSTDGQPVVFEVKHVGRNLRLFVIKGHHAYYATHGCKKPKKRQLPKEVQKSRELFEQRQQS